MDNLGALNVFVRAAETRSFTEAGRQLGVSSSAVGKAIARLEERLGVRLFHRSTRSITLTHEGTVFLESCRRIFSEIEVAEMELAQIKRAPSGRLRVSLPLVGMLLMPVMGRFMAAYPDIELDLDFTDRMVNVIDDGFDVVVRTGEVSDSRLIAHILGTFSLRLIGSRDYFARAGIPAVPADLKNHACLHHKFPNTGKLERWPLIPDAEGNDVELPTTMVASTMEPLIHLAEQGMGIVCVPDFFVRQQLADGSLLSVLEEHIEHKGWFRAVWPSSRYLSPKVRVFVDFLVEHVFPKDAVL
ncbi:LysR family transcriptional regulator [Undibacterium sp. TJN25]|uniref:LysR family transcriptional regulator n=1 Tax=Undibacterium sp. TJN25 TaxID=3413056 RepID=UPI003BF136E9